MKTKALPWHEIKIMPLGDIQLGSPGVDLERLRKHIRWGVDNEVFFLGMGDYVDFLSPSNRRYLKNAGLYDTANDLIEEWHRRHLEELKEILAPTKGMWIGLHEGHHYFEYGDGTTSDTQLAQFLEAPFLGTCAVTRLSFRAGSNYSRAVDCLIWSHHGEGAGQDPLARLLRVAPGFPQVDIFVQGHNTQIDARPKDTIWFYGGPGELHMRDKTQMFVASGGFMRGYQQGSRHAGRAQGCVPTNTAMLTRRGWTLPNDLVLGEEVAAFDPKTECLRWTPLRAINVFEDDTVYKVGSRKGGAGWWATAEHRWFAARGRKQTLGVLTTKELTKHTPIQVAAPLVEEMEGSVLTSKEAAILGWIVTDGWFYPWSAQAGIVQKKEPFLSEVRSLVGNIATEYVGQGGAHYFMLRLAAVDLLFAKACVAAGTYEGIETLVTRLDRPARQAMKTAMEHAEGHRGSRGWRFSQKRETVLKAWEILCVLEGERLGALGQDPESGVYNRRNGLPLRATVRTLDPEAQRVPFVWCPTTDYGSWVMRQADGAITITGNSYVERAMMRPTAIGGPLITVSPRHRKDFNELDIHCSV